MKERVTLVVNGEVREILLIETQRNAVRFQIQEREYLVEFQACVPAVADAGSSGKSRPSLKSTSSAKRSASHPGGVLAPIPGVISEILITEGQQVVEGELLLRLEAMKMQNAIFAPSAGTVQKILVEVGKEVMDEECLLVISNEA